MNDLIPVSLPLTDIANDTIQDIGGSTYSNTTATALVAVDARFWIEPDFEGNDHLCTTQQEGLPLTISATNNSTPYTNNSEAFVAAVDTTFNFIGGRPPVKR